MIHPDPLGANLEMVRNRMASAAERAGRNMADIALVAVTKTQPLAVIQAAYDLGLRCFGENRVEDAEAKVSDLPSDISWHMIGHIQSRKAGRVASIFQFVHSVDSVRLARRLNRTCADREQRLPVLMEVNVTGEGSKYGFAANRWRSDSAQQTSLLEAISEIVELPNLQVSGLMTMAPIVADPEAARPVFANLRLLRDDLAQAFPSTSWHHLSMGMTDDFEIAIEEGASIIRVGRAIFGPRLARWSADMTGGM